MKIENNFSDIKDTYDQIKAPDEMEQALHAALEEDRLKPANNVNSSFIRRYRGMLAAAILLLTFFVYCFDTMAYYVKKLNHYDEIVNGSIQKLNDADQGQVFDKSCTFSDGSTLTLDKLFFDDNQCVILYSFRRPDADISESLPRLDLLGLISVPPGYLPESGRVKDLGDGTFVGMQTFQPPAFYEKWMKIKISWLINGQYEEQIIPFTLSRTRAMFKTVHQNIAQKIELDGCTISFDSISASPLSTSINGSLDEFSQSDIDIMKGNIKRLLFDIVADQKTAATFYAGINSNNGAATFGSTGDALPENFNTVQIRNIRFETIKMVDKEVDIGPLVNQPPVDVVLNDDLIIKEIRQDGDQITVAIESSGIPVMGLFADGNQLPWINEEEVKAVNSDAKTFIFNGTGSDLQLLIKCISYVESSDAIITIK